MLRDVGQYTLYVCIEGSQGRGGSKDIRRGFYSSIKRTVVPLRFPVEC